HLPEIREKVEKYPSPYVLVDTPGQMELFLYRDFGPRFVEEFREVGYIIGVVILDPTLVAKAHDVVSLKLQAMIVSLRLGIDAIPVVNKADAQTFNPRLLTDAAYLREQLAGTKGLSSEISERILELLDEYRLAIRIPLISSITGQGLEELYDLLHEIFCACGDLT
ncbi:MAG: ATP/GTP-binding protein, partial [Thermogladius sp.]